MLSLPDLQRAFFEAIKPVPGATGGVPSSGAVEAEICGDDRLDAGERLAVYARMYVARLVDVLIEDYPRIAAVVGAERFAELARAYVAHHPSTHPSLRWFGRHFPAFLARQGEGSGLASFIGDLARLEWARLAVFDAEDASPLDVESLRRVPPEGWPTLRLRCVPAVELLHVAWPVHRIWEASEHGLPAGDWRPEDTWLRVWRQEARVYQAGMDGLEREAFAHLRAGEEFGALCAGLATLVPAERAAETAGAMVLRWIEDGILVGIATNGD
jgi:hypothetical protein